MERFFNNAGPSVTADHYCLDPLARLHLPDLMALIEQKRYFILHAPRQTGKTTSLLALMHHLNQGNQYKALYTNVEPGQAHREDIAGAMKTILSGLAGDADFYLDDLWLKDHFNAILEQAGPGNAFVETLSQWCERSDKPVVLMLDEIDALVGDTLISVLRQLRSGYAKRPSRFPISVILCGVRDVKDYRIHSSTTKEIITGGSTFNIKAKSLRLGDFDRDESLQLINQHTDETGQQFTAKAQQMLWEFSYGQPWILNSLAYNACFDIKAGRDRSQPITEKIILEAREMMVQGRVTHLDQLADKLTEERVRSIVLPLLESGHLPEKIRQDDLQYVSDLGLIRLKPQVEIANPIYREVIPRELTFSTQVTIAHQSHWYIDATSGLLRMAQLLSAFQQFYREHSEAWMDGFAYREAGAQLFLQAFLQRIVNGGGRIEREYGLGMRRTDLLIVWPGQDGDPFDPTGVQRVVIELKRLRPKDGADSVLEQGFQQTATYMDTCNATEGHLIIVDQRPNKTWDERIYQKTITTESSTEIGVWGL